MSLIDDLKQLDAEQYREYGWGLMVIGKCGDLATTWYALVSIPTFIEGNPLPAMAYGAYGVLGLVLLNGLAILAVTIVTEAGSEYLRRRDAGQLATQSVFIVGYWLPGLFWLFVTYSNAQAVSQAQAVLGL